MTLGTDRIAFVPWDDAFVTRTEEMKMTRFDLRRAAATRATRWAAAALLALVGCGERSSSVSHARAPNEGGLVVAGGGSGAPSTACVEPVGGAPSERQRGVDALLRHSSAEANAIFVGVLAKNPGDLGAETLRIASAKDLARSNASASADFEQAAVSSPPALPLHYQLVRPAAAQGQDTLHLDKVSMAKNLITDDDAWLKKNGLTPPTRRPRPEEIPEFVAAQIHGARLDHLFVHADHQIGVYGKEVGVFAPGLPPRAFDLSRMAVTEGRVPLDVDFAEVAGKVLFLQLSHNGYAKEVGGKNGFIAAVDIDTGALLWCSEPLVGNAQNFVIVGRHLVAGYGFTAEPDFLFVLDTATGKTEEKQSLPSGPTYLLRKDDKLFIRTYDTDLVYRFSPSAPAAPEASLGSGASARSVDVDPEIRCFVDVALKQIDGRDARGLADTIEALRSRRSDETLLLALSGAQSFLSERHDHPGIDLGTRPIVVVEPPTWEYAFRGVGSTPSNATASTAKTPRLRAVSRASADPVRDMRAPKVFDPSKPLFLAPVEKGKLPPGARGDIPSSFGVDDLRAVIPSGDRLILIYGGRYVAIVNGSTTEYVLDFEAYRHPPKANPQWAEFAVEDVTFAHVEGTVLYVSNGGGSYAREVFGKKAFMSAIDLTTGKLIWRSDPLVAGSTFGIVGDFIATGYGFTDEPDNLFLLRRDTGKVAAKAHLDSAPESVVVSGTRVHVESYSNAYDFEVDLDSSSQSARRAVP